MTNASAICDPSGAGTAVVQSAHFDADAIIKTTSIYDLAAWRMLRCLPGYQECASVIGWRALLEHVGWVAAAYIRLGADFSKKATCDMVFTVALAAVIARAIEVDRATDARSDVKILDRFLGLFAWDHLHPDRHRGDRFRPGAHWRWDGVSDVRRMPKSGDLDWPDRILVHGHGPHWIVRLHTLPPRIRMMVVVEIGNALGWSQTRLPSSSDCYCASLRVRDAVVARGISRRPKTELHEALRLAVEHFRQLTGGRGWRSGGEHKPSCRAVMGPKSANWCSTWAVQRAMDN
jgi:hypothetical protein